MWSSYVKFDENDRVEDIAFCEFRLYQISTVSALKDDHCNGKNKEEVEELAQPEMVQGQSGLFTRDKMFYSESQNSHNGLPCDPLAECS